MAAAAAITGFAINWWAGLLSILSSAAFGTAFFMFTRTRYKSLAQLSNQIDLVLHNTDRLFIDDSDEGELSILQSEIAEMTLRIREQNDALKKEKGHLADSLADIAHQLLTPLTSANLILSRLENTPDENEQKALARETEELLARMDWLLTSLLKLSRLDAGIVVFQNEQADLNGLIHASLRPFLIPMDLHNISVQTKIPDGLTIPCDPGWLSEAVQNILKNSMENTGDNGNIEIVCTDTLLYIEISIHDNGPGFKNEDLPHLFDRFYRGKSTNTSGYGIGLALSKTIITRQGGTITARNHPRGGALFTLHFPK